MIFQNELKNVGIKIDQCNEYNWFRLMCDDFNCYESFSKINFIDFKSKDGQIDNELSIEICFERIPENISELNLFNILIKPFNQEKVKNEIDHSRGIYKINFPSIEYFFGIILQIFN